MTDKEKIENIYLCVPAAQEKEIKRCFTCGKVLFAGISFAGVPCIPCGQDVCEYEEKKKYIGKHKLNGVIYKCWLRKLKTR